MRDCPLHGSIEVVEEILLGCLFDCEEEWNDSRSTMKSTQAVIAKRFMKVGFIKAYNTCLKFKFPTLLSSTLKFMKETESHIQKKDIGSMHCYLQKCH